MFSKVLPLLRHTLTPAAALEVAKVHLKNARETENSEVALTFCGEAVTAMSRIGRSARRALVSSSRVEDRRLCSEIAATYIELGELLHSLGSQSKAKACYWEHSGAGPIVPSLRQSHVTPYCRS
ncbi:hypothetical protein EDD21DRAFT_356730 [Dissophora ornata]|nr:hypothetical protein EDD21DRAFT_356730 [Dissophora ornata]